jgi:hypothetical protein
MFSPLLLGITTSQQQVPYLPLETTTSLVVLLSLTHYLGVSGVTAGSPLTKCVVEGLTRGMRQDRL